MKLTKILVALSFLFAVSTANAGELTVTGNMEVTYHTTQEGGTTGNPLGTDRELKFAGSTELDNGITVSVMQDTNDSLTYGNSQLSFGNVGGFATVYVGSDHDPLDAIDDITPSAYEEANGSGSGTYVDIGGLASEMGIGVKFDLPILGSVNYKYYPQVDGTKNADNANSGAGTASADGYSVTVKTSMADLPVVGSYLGNLALTTGYSLDKVSNVANTDDGHEATAAITGSAGNFSFGYQRKYDNAGQTAAGTDAVFYKDEVIGIAYAINDELSISYNSYTSEKHTGSSGGQNIEQETDAINVGYTMGGMTIGLQDASTDNANFTKNAKDDTRTLGISVAF